MRVLTALFLAVSQVVGGGVSGQPSPPPPPRPATQGQPPRDVGRRPEPTGTGVIRGRVVAADTGNPIRRAMVNLSPMAPPMRPIGTSPPGAPASGTPPLGTTTSTRTMTANGVTTQMTSGVAMGVNLVPRSSTTDSQGAFEFTRLPAGIYRLQASAGQYSAAYLGMAYGAKKPNGPGFFDPGTPIQLAEGERFDKAVVALPKGAVITGRVSDDNGDPMARVQVYTMFLAPGSTRPQRTGSGAQTDDLGQFRLYGLMPGDYFVIAEASRNTFVPPNAAPETEEEKIGFMTTYFPGTPDEGSAQRVRTRAGGETPGVEMRMATGRLFRISGMITDSQGRTSNRISGTLFRRLAAQTSTFGFSTDEQGRFQMRNIPPGEYRLVARGRPMGPDVAQNEPGEMANVPLTIGADVDGLMIVTAPGAVVTGEVVFEQGPPVQPGQNAPPIRVNAQMGDPENNTGMPGPQPAVVSPDNTFTLKGMMGEFLLRGNAQGQFLKRVMIGADEITDTPREFKTGDKVTLVMTSRASTIEGNITDAAGKPVTDAALIIFSDDKASWRISSIRTRRANADQNGHYRAMGLMPGRYYVIATSRERLNIPVNADPAFFEQLAKEATTFVVGEDEQRQVDLKMVLLGGGE